jgi:hypothetical protein
VMEFNKIIMSYVNIPENVRPTSAIAKMIYNVSHDSYFPLLLRERKSLHLDQLFDNALDFKINMVSLRKLLNYHSPSPKKSGYEE